MAARTTAVLSNFFRQKARKHCIVDDKYLDPRSLRRLDICCPDHLAPFLGFVCDQLAEVGG